MQCSPEAQHKKLITVGDDDVGKTSFLRCEESFSEEQITLNVDFVSRSVESNE